jgi:hypothetical protein
VAGAAHVIEPPSTILCRRWHEGALHLSSRRSSRRSWWLQCRGSNGRFPNRLLWRNRTRRLDSGTASPPLTLLLRARGGLHSS